MSTPLKAIRQKCLWCCLDQVHEIRLCRSGKSCPIWLLRFGKSVRGVSPLRAIRAKCLDCVGGSPSDVKACSPVLDHLDNCSLWPFRFGTNPNFSVATREAQRRRRLDYWRKKGDSRGDFDTNETGDDLGIGSACLGCSHDQGC